MIPIDLASLLAITARGFGMLISLPTGEALGTLPRLFIAICFSAALTPTTYTSLEFSWYIIVAEFVFGLILAAPVRFIADGAEMFGEVVDTARGQTIGSVIDPLNGQQVSDMATIMRLSAVVLAIQFGGLEQMILALRQSQPNLLFGAIDLNSEVVVGLFRKGLSISGTMLALASVWLVAYLIIDIVCAACARVSQGLQFTSLSTLLKMIATFVLLLNIANQPGELYTLIVRYTSQGWKLPFILNNSNSVN